MVRNFNVTEKIKCHKIDKFYFKTPEGRIKNFLNTVEEKTVKQN